MWVQVSLTNRVYLLSKKKKKTNRVYCFSQKKKKKRVYCH